MKGTLVYHLIHVRTPYRHIPKLLIRGAHVSKEDLNRAGFEFSEFGIPWANHGVLHFDRMSDIPADAVPALRAGDVPTYDAEEFREKVEAEV